MSFLMHLLHFFIVLFDMGIASCHIQIHPRCSSILLRGWFLCNVHFLRNSSKVQGLIDKTINAPKGKLYLSDTEFQYAAQSLNGMRNAYLSAGRSSGGIDRVLAKLMSSKYRNVPVR